MTAWVMIYARKAVPVRAVPYVTGWSLSPLDLAHHLARKDAPPFDFFNDVVAHHVSARVPEKILPKEWDQVVAQLEGLEAQIRATYQDEIIGYAEWRNRSVQLLPAGVFLFKRDFERGWRRKFRSSHYKEKRKGDSALNYTPLIPVDKQSEVMVGFEDFLRGEPSERTNKAKANSPARCKPGSNPKEIWTEEARRVADELHLRDKACGAHSSTKDIAERVAKEFLDRRIEGPRGPLRGGTISREALQGSLWRRPQPDDGETGKTGKRGNPANPMMTAPK